MLVRLEVPALVAFFLCPCLGLAPEVVWAAEWLDSLDLIGDLGADAFPFGDGFSDLVAFCELSAILVRLSNFLKCLATHDEMRRKASGPSIMQTSSSALTRLSMKSFVAIDGMCLRSFARNSAE